MQLTLTPQAAGARQDCVHIAFALASGPLTVPAIVAASRLPTWLVLKRLRQNGTNACSHHWRYFGFHRPPTGDPVYNLTERGRAEFAIMLTVPASPPSVTHTPPSSPTPRKRVYRRPTLPPRTITKPPPAPPIPDPPTPTIPFAPTSHAPGTPGKLAILEFRARHKLPLHHPKDATNPDADLSRVLTLFASTEEPTDGE